ncbi:MAG: RepB family plasmid replication initiator protein [Bacteroidetes bacterium]|nr:RepB family plasmid replication initiator protein [Bacteroidota bacterium]
MQTEKTKFLVTQSNKLIEANYSANLTTLAHKVAKLILGFVNPEEQCEKISITVDISKLKYYLGWVQGKKWNRFPSDLKDISKRLNKEPIEIAINDDEVLVVYFLSSYRLNIAKGEVTFNVSPELVPYLTQLKKNFTTYQLNYIPKLTSSYAIRMYELFHQYLRIGNRRFTIEDFRKKVGAPESYKYNDLKKRVIIPAQEQLKENTNLAFMYSEIKEGRSVAELVFVIFGNTPVQNKAQMELSFLADTIEEGEEVEPAFSGEIVGTLKGIGITDQNIIKYLAQGFDIIGDKERIPTAIERCKNLEGYYREKLALAERSNSRSNTAGFVVKALREDWVSDKALQEHKGRVATKKHHDKENKIKALEKQVEELSRKWEGIKAPLVESLMADEAITKSVYDTVLDGMGGVMRQHLSKILHLPIFEQYNESPFIHSGMNVEFARRYPEQFAKAEEVLAQIKKTNKDIEFLNKT